MEVGGELLKHLADAGQPLSMAALSAASDLPLNQVFTYLVSLVRTGLARRDPMTHRYEPGPLAMKLGLHALAQLSPLRETFRRANELAKAADHGAFIAIWTDQGPTVIRYQCPDSYMHTGLHVGAVMSVAHSSTGRLFAALLPRHEVQALWDRDVAKRDGESNSGGDELLDYLLRDVRERRLARTMGLPIPGIDSISAPIFGQEGEVMLAVTVFGPTNTIDIAWDGETAGSLLALTEELSEADLPVSAYTA
ncbi:IclR family transcriptional regulator [Caballeronia calidae]|nr:IclR family transcriptional regulator C-terminal domain-containing protein [Caballeronia calidae]